MSGFFRRGVGFLLLLGLVGPAQAASAGVEAGRIVEHPPSGEVTWTYYTYVPASALKAAPARLVILCQGYRSTMIDNYEDAKAGAWSFLASHQATADKSGYVLLAPAAPSTSNWMGPMLTRATILADEPFYRRPDWELLRMLNQFRASLAQDGLALAERVHIAGFSAGGKFSLRFALLNPGLVRGVGSGGGGATTWPLGLQDGQLLTYPLGVGDLDQFTGSPFDPAALQAVAFRTFTGAEDDNDCWYYASCWETWQVDFFLSHFGTTPPQLAQNIHDSLLSLGLRSEFQAYPGIKHDYTAGMMTDLFDFFRRLDQEL